MSTLQMSQFARLISSILCTQYPHILYSKSLFFSLFLFTNQPHTQWHQESTEDIYDTYMVFFYLFFIYYLN